MARTCELCDRGTVTSATRSHSNIQTKRKTFINVQKKTIEGKKIAICTKCLRTRTKKMV